MITLKADEILKELQRGVTNFSAMGTPVKLLATDHAIRHSDGATQMESVDISDQKALGDKLSAIVLRLVADEGKGCIVFKYGGDYRALIISTDRLLIDLPNIGEEGQGTIFDISRHYVDDSTKERICADVEAAHSPCRCRVVEGKENGFLVELFHEKLRPMVKLADKGQCSIHEVLKRIEDGAELTQ